MPVTVASHPTLGVAQRPFRRSASGAVLGGVCAGLAVRFGVREQSLRLAFAIFALVAGLGLVLYLLLWLFVARSGEDHSIAENIATQGKMKWVMPLFALIVTIVVLSTILSRGTWVLSGFIPSLMVSSVGCVIIWFGSSDEEKALLRSLASATPGLSATTVRGWRGVMWRVIPGVILISVGFHVLNHVGGVWSAALPALIGAFVVVAGLLVLLAPWWLRTVRDLTVERRERMRMQERAAMATQIHDSVLQTLTLIERAAANESDVVRLARAQERSLRQWLFDPAGASSPTSFATLAAQIQADVEDAYGVRIELVVVGDCEVDDRAQALLGAAREATVNAAKWSGATSISLYAEVEAEQISAFVRDLGRGFDLDEIPTDRKGIELSIRGRLEAVGGRVSIRSEVGAGTEVELVLPRSVS
ncbi:MAG TPA: PspC domain-containing protein [Acidimicrobiales bacterium]|nr:PspC domain-containing protein [Acidimicrobiales bacterium]